MWNANKKEHMVQPQFDVDAFDPMMGITSRAQHLLQQLGDIVKTE